MKKLYRKSPKIKKLVLLFSILLSISLFAGVSPGGWIVNTPLVEPCQIITASIESTVPAADGTGTVVVGKGETVNFSGSAIFSTSGLGATYSWGFGDGDVSNGLEVSHLFNTIGTFNVTLTVTDTNPEGCTDTQTITVQVLSPYLQIDQVTYTPTQLIEDILINSPCANVSNLVSSTGTNFGSSDGIGYFSGDGVSFPFTEGIILTTGNAGSAGGPETVGLSDGSIGWLGDADLENALESLAPGVTNNATFIEFDFVPLADAISFNFVFASEEYGEFQCEYTDAFAFLLTDSDGVTTNLAIVPGTDDPISVLSVRDSAYNDPNINCASVNPEFFAAYYGPGGLPPSDSPTNFIGHTVNLIAQAAVIPNTSYSIKLVIADDQDTNYDAAVFLEAGSFDLAGGDLGDDITIELGTAQCVGTTVILDTNAPTAPHVWYLNGTEIPGEILSTLTITEPGTYSANTIFNETCASSDSILVEFVPVPVVVAVENLEICDGGATNFDLTQNNASILGTQSGTEYVISFHSSQEDADADADPISNEDAVAFSGVDGQQIYVRIEYLTTGCYGTDSFLLNLFNQPTIFPVDDLVVCDDASNDGVDVFDLTLQSDAILDTQSSVDFVVSYYTSFEDADAGTNALLSPYTNVTSPEPIFVRVDDLSEFGCHIASPTSEFSLVVNNKATVFPVEDLEVCDDDFDGFMTFDLEDQTPIVLGTQTTPDFEVSYHETQLDADGNTAPLTSPYINTTVDLQTIYVRVQEDALSSCYETTQFDLIVLPIPTTVVMTSLDICDDDTDGFGAFTLTDKDIEALDGQLGVQLSYHASQLDVDLDQNPLASPYTNTTADLQTIFVRIENTTTDCYNSMPLELVVNPLPIPNAPLSQTVCDDDFDGFATFDLTDAGLFVVGTQLGMEVSFHTSPTDADANLDAVTSPFETTTEDFQTLHIRLEEVATGCYSTTTLDLFVDPLPVVPVIFGYVLCDDPNSGDLQAFFDLSSKDLEIINDQNSSVSYYATLLDATNDVDPLTSPYENTSNFETIYVSLTDLTTGCRSTGSFNLIVQPLPTTVVMTSLDICDDDTDGFGAFTLTDKDIEALDGQLGVQLSYHASQLDVDLDQNPLASPYTNTTADLQTIFVRIENTTTDCYNSMSLELVVNPLPIPNAPLSQTVCDDDFDGFATFDLTDAGLFVVGTQLGMEVSFHTSSTDADANLDAVTSPFETTTEDFQTLHIRLEEVATGCYSTTTLDLFVDPLPVVPVISDYELCDDPNSGDLQSFFDLNSKDLEIINDQNSSVSYYATLLDATNDVDPLTSPYENTSNPETIYVSLTDLTTGCRSTGSFNLIVNPLPQLVISTALEVCDDGVADGLTSIDLTLMDDEISGGNINYSISYYLTQLEAESGVDPLVIPYTNTSNPQTIFARGQDINTGCFNTVPLEISVAPVVVASTPQPLEYCDVNSDGFGVFTLTDTGAEITGGDPELMVTYHETLLDAENGVGALASPYTNSVINTQTLFGRVISTTIVTNCPTIVDVELIVHPTPQLLPPTPLELCDDDTDAFATFNLTTKVPEFLNGISAADVSINYYETNADAESESNAIGFPFGYVNLSNPQTIWIRVSYNDTGCNKLTSLDLIVNPLPVLIQPDPLFLCDSNNPGDEQEFFLLEDSAAQILDGQTGLSISYHISELDANGNLNPLVSPYANISNPQTIYVRVENDSTGCSDFKTLTLEVFQNPTSIAPVDLFLCDDTLSGDGQEVFDLTTNELIVLNGELDVTPTYFETFLDAELETNIIIDPINYTNTTISVQTVFIRVTNDITGCFTIVDFDLIVWSLPFATPVEDWMACELMTDNVYAFDLDSQSGLILGTQSPSAYEVTYYETLLDATGGTNSLVSPYENITNPQTIFVSVTNTNTGCKNTVVNFDLEVFEAAQATAPLSPYTLCDDTVEMDGNPINDTMQFDLSTQNIEVLNGQDPSAYIVRYFASQFDADEDINELPTLYENTINPQVIIVRVDNDTQVLGSAGALSDSSTCYETASLTLQVNPLPIVDLEDDYVVCIGSDGTGFLNIPTGLSEVDYAFIWKNASGTVIGTRSSGFISQGGTYSLEVFDVSFPTNCAAPIAIFTVLESASPIVTAQVTSTAFATTHSIEAQATGLGVYEFSLDLGPWQTSGSFEDVSKGEHVITARDVNGCGEAEAVVYVIDYPRYFTPNGDGFHDTWNIIGISDQYDLKVYIFDRYGKLLKQISPTGLGWDGTYNGVPLPTSDYWFMIDYNEPTTGNANQLKRHFTLKR